MALWMGRPVLRSQTIAVSRWFVMPMAVIASAPILAWARASIIVLRCVSPISIGSCSPPPGARKSVVSGKSVSVLDDLGGLRIIKQQYLPAHQDHLLYHL